LPIRIDYDHQAGTSNPVDASNECAGLTRADSDDVRVVSRTLGTYMNIVASRRRVESGIRAYGDVEIPCRVAIERLIAASHVMNSGRIGEQR